ncbi:unnamed protein product [Caenorhabditis sp. 36 PRJEB53466]|nr:unnamed protein product [Caenorhabditis sp. 36 PRJEB53466]
MSVGSLIDLSAEKVAQNILVERFRPSTIDFSVPSGNRVFEHAIKMWPVLYGAPQSTIENVLEELAELKFTEANFYEACIESRFFPILLKQSLIALTIGSEVRTEDEDLEAGYGNEDDEIDIVQVLESLSSADTRQNLMHLDVSTAPDRLFDENWMERVGRLFRTWKA